MRILVLTQWYPPEPAEIIAGLVQEFARAGHSVQVLTGLPNYPSGRLYPNYRLHMLQREVLRGVPVVRVPLYPNHGRSPVKRALNYLSFALSATLEGPLACRRPDIIWVYHPPLTVAIPAMWMAGMHRAPFVYTVQDLWPETLRATGMVSNRLIESVMAGLARAVYARAAAVTVISPGFKANLIGKGVPARKVHVIPNWADESLYGPVPRDPSIGAAYGLAGRFNVIFAGNLGAAQGLDTVLQAAAMLQPHEDIQFVFIGDGVELPALRVQAGRLALSNVRFLERQPAERMREFYAWADALLVCLRDDPLFRITIPSKLLAYLACGRPIVCSVAGDAADIVRQAASGTVCTPGSAEGLAQAILQLRALPAAEREAMGQAGHSAFLRSYTRGAVAKQYLALFDRVAGLHNGQHSTTV